MKFLKQLFSLSFYKSVFVLLFLCINSFSYVIHINNPFAGDSLFISSETVADGSAITTRAMTEDSKRYTISIEDDRSKSSNLVVSPSPKANSSAISIGTINTIFAETIQKKEVWLQIDQSGIVSKTFNDPFIEDRKVDIVLRPKAWNDTVRVFLIWNSGAHDIVKNATPDYVKEAISPIKNVIIRSREDSDWESIAKDTTLSELKNVFKGTLPHVIIYVNSGYKWDSQNLHPKATEPYELLKSAADSGIGLVAIGDDAAFDGQFIFPMTGPDGTGEVINKDDLMGTAKAYKDVWIWLDPAENKFLPDGGLLWSVTKDTMHFITRDEGRHEADADRWSIDTNWLDNYSFLGFQQALRRKDSSAVHPEPTYYKTISALQRNNQRIAMLSYEPQFIRDTTTSSQIIYNSVYWSSKAHEKLKIPTPVADPNSSEYSTGDDIEISVPLHNKELYNLYYTVNGSDYIPYTGPISTKDLGNNFTITAKAFATNTDDWLDSDEMIEHYSKGELIAAMLTVDKGDIVYSTDSLIVTISTNEGNTITYDLYNADSTEVLESGTFVTSGIITIKGDVILAATASGEGYLETSDSWFYTKEKKDPVKAKLEVSEGNIIYSTDSLVVTISSNDGNTITYEIYNADSTEVLESGTFETSGIITIKGDVILAATASGEGYLETSDSWFYTKEKKIPLKAKLEVSEGNIVYSTDSLNVTISSNEGNTITYELFNADSTKVLESGTFVTTGIITIKGDMILVATASGEGYLETSGSWFYDYSISATASGAWFKDNDGNGTIDAVTIKTDALPYSHEDDLFILPDSIEFLNPFATNEILVARREDMRLTDSVIVVTLPDEFSHPTNIITSFHSGKYGRFFGEDYASSEFEISDSIAPLVSKALYKLGKIHKVDNDLVFNIDTLKIEFSENVTASGFSTSEKRQYFQLYREGEGSYHFMLTCSNVSENLATFLVNERKGNNDYPVSGDSIRIWFEDSISAEVGNVAQVYEKNRYCPLEVINASVEPEVYTIDPVNPKEFTIPEYLMGSSSGNKKFTHGLPIIVDYLIPLSDGVKNHLDAKISIFDYAGNCVASTEGRSDNGDSNIEVTECSQKSTMLVAIWDGTNKLGREVSTGSYLMKISYSDSSGKQMLYKTLVLGIKK